MTVRAMAATMASLPAIGNDLVAKFEGVLLMGENESIAETLLWPESEDVGQVLSMELLKRKEFLGEKGKLRMWKRALI